MFYRTPAGPVYGSDHRPSTSDSRTLTLDAGAAAVGVIGIIIIGMILYGALVRLAAWVNAEAERINDLARTDAVLD